MSRCRLLLITALLPACAPMTALQSPRALAPGESLLAANASIPSWFFSEEENLWATLSAGVRFGVGPRTDAGVRIGLLDGVSADVKHELLDGPFLVSGTLATSLLLADEEGRISLGLHPGLLFGTERLYGAVRMISYPQDSWSEPMVGFSLGAVLGERARLLPEVAYYPSFDGEPVVFLGLSLQRLVERKPDPS